MGLLPLLPIAEGHHCLKKAAGEGSVVESWADPHHSPLGGWWRNSFPAVRLSPQVSACPSSTNSLLHVVPHHSVLPLLVEPLLGPVQHMGEGLLP